MNRPSRTDSAFGASSSAEEQICFLFRHFDRAGLDAIMTLSNRGALWVQRRAWSPKTLGLARGFITSRAPLEDILEVQARPHRPFQRWAMAFAAAGLFVSAGLSMAQPLLASLYLLSAVGAGFIARYWPPVLVIVARAGRFSYRGPWSLNRRTLSDVDRALREVVAWSREHHIRLVGNPHGIDRMGQDRPLNPICIEITSFNPATEGMG